MENIIRGSSFEVEEIKFFEKGIKAYILKLKKPISDEEFNYFLSFVSPQKRKRLKGPNKDAMLMGEVLAKSIIENNYGIKSADFVYGEHGKPYLEDCPDIHFNISHSGEYVACIVSERPVGIDVQTIREYNEKVAKRVCNDKEIAEIENSTDASSAFIKLWTKKEAVLKMLGTGIGTADIKNCLGNYKVYSKKIDNYWLSVCIE